MDTPTPTPPSTHRQEHAPGSKKALFVGTGLMVVAVVAGILIYSRSPTPTRSGVSLVESLRDKGLSPSASPGAVRPGMLLHVGTFLPVADVNQAFKKPEELHLIVQPDYLKSADYEDHLEATIEGKAGFTTYLGEASLEANARRASSVVTHLEHARFDSVSDESLANAELNPKFVALLANNEAVVLVQGVLTAEQLTVDYLDEKGKEIKGTTPQGSGGSSSSGSQKSSEVFSNKVLGIETAIIGSFEGDPAAQGHAADDLKAKGYSPKLVGKFLLVKSDQAGSEKLAKVVVAAAAEGVAIRRHETDSKLVEAAKLRAQAARDLPLYQSRSFEKPSRAPGLPH